MSCQLEQDVQKYPTFPQKTENEAEISQNYIRREQINKLHQQERLDQNQLITEQIILHEDLPDRAPFIKSSSNSKFKIVACSVIAVLATFLLVSAFFIFAAPYIPALKEKMNPYTTNRDEPRSAAEITPSPNGLTSPKPVSAVESTGGLKWNNWLDPLGFFTFKYQTLDEVTASFAGLIPKDCNAKEMKLTVFIRSINENPWRDFWTKIRVFNGEEQFSHSIMATALPRDMIVMVTETFVVPIEKTREIRIRATTKRQTGSMLHSGLKDGDDFNSINFAKNLQFI